jgi:hypothetical protein
LNWKEVIFWVNHLDQLRLEHGDMCGVISRFSIINIPLSSFCSSRSASPIKHVAYSNDGTFFATASQVIERENKFCLFFFLFRMIG